MKNTETLRRGKRTSKAEEVTPVVAPETTEVEVVDETVEAAAEQALEETITETPIVEEQPVEVTPEPVVEEKTICSDSPVHLFQYPGGAYEVRLTTPNGYKVLSKKTSKEKAQYIADSYISKHC